MALVDYASSDESGCEDSASEENSERVKGQIFQTSKSENSETNLFSVLPKPKEQMILFGKEDKLNNFRSVVLQNDLANKKEHVKILVPSLREFENDEDCKPIHKKLKPSTKGAGLFSVLPPPKNVTVKESKRQLIPQVVNNKINKVKVSDLPDKSFHDVSSVQSKSDDDDGENDNDETVVNSYFGDGISNSNLHCIDVNAMGNFNLMVNQGSSNTYNIDGLPDSKEVNCNDDDGKKVVEAICDNSNIKYDVEQKNSGALELDEKALQILCGGKRKRTQMPMNIIDLSGEEIMPDSKEWLLKQLSQERKIKSHSHRKHEGPSVQQRRKHQITYLAFQAKEQELELQNQWSNNRMSRKQTQSKYGF